MLFFPKNHINERKKHGLLSIAPSLLIAIFMGIVSL